MIGGSRLINLKVYCGYKIDENRFLHRLELRVSPIINDLFNRSYDENRVETESSVAYCMSDSDMSLMSKAEDTWAIQGQSQT